MSIEGQIRRIVKEELEAQLEEIEKRFRRLVEEELQKIEGRLSDIEAKTEKIDGELNNKWNLLAKLRRHTLDQLMSEYRKVENLVRPEKTETEETAEI